MCDPGIFPGSDQYSWTELCLEGFSWRVIICKCSIEDYFDEVIDIVEQNSDQNDSVVK